MADEPNSCDPIVDGRCGGIVRLTSTDGSVAIASPTGPTADLSTTGAAAPPSGVAVGVAVAPTRALGTYAVLDNMSVTLTSRGGKLHCAFVGTFNTRTGDNWDAAVFVDGVQLGKESSSQFFGGSLLGLTPAEMQQHTLAVLALSAALAPGVHTVDVRWRANAGTARAVGTKRTLVVHEV